MKKRHRRAADPLWYKDAVFYELRVRSFFDSNADGIGDFQGLTQKLDYLQDLGVTTLWLLPFYPSPLRDDGYDISDYLNVHPDVGTLRDFKAFLRAAHERGLRVVTELVLNHTSDQHPWFQRARRAPVGSAHRDFYVWSETPDQYSDARIIFKDYENSNWAWDAEARAYYWHRFYSHQPDLNFDNPRVRSALFHTMDFWLQLGVDGLRLDAVPYLFEREGTNCENLEEGHQVLRDLRAHIDAHYADRMLLAEANQWPEDAAAYFGDGDQCHMAFHFPVMPRLFMAVRMEDRHPIVDILNQTPEIPDPAQWAMFLRNHDELTLEMVTDEERDYMYRAYAADQTARLNLGIRRRLAPLLSNERKRIELMNALLFSMPGTPVIYYGDEIGMGDNFYLGDRHGVRTPMQWNGDRNAGFSRANPQKLYLPVIIDPEYHYETVNVETQQSNPHSLLWWMKRIIALRKQYKALGRGKLQLLHPRNSKVLVFVRSWEDQEILVVCNLSRFVQYVELDLSSWEGSVPVELFGRTEFPAIGKHPYLLTLGPHSFYWFALEPQRREALQVQRRERPIGVRGVWREVFEGEAREALDSLLPEYLLQRRWFGGKARGTKSAHVVEILPVSGTEHVLTAVRVQYKDGSNDTYLLPMGFAEGADAENLRQYSPHAVIVPLTCGSGDEVRTGVLFDAAHEAHFRHALLEVIRARRRLRGAHGQAVGSVTRVLRGSRQKQEPLQSAILGAEQSNTSIVYGEKYILKLFRRLGDGVNPDLEVGRFLTESARFPCIPPLAGALEYRSETYGLVTTFAVLQEYVPNSGDAWSYTLGWLDRFLSDVLTLPARGAEEVLESPRSQVALGEVPAAVNERLGSYLEFARLLGRRTGGLHLALASSPDNPSFAPEAIPAHHARSLYQSVRTQVGHALRLLRDRLDVVPEASRSDATKLLDSEEQLLAWLAGIKSRKLTGKRIRIHGDFHLGQVLVTGRDVAIIDFEGEPERPISERGIKRMVLRDVAGMLRSFHYAAYAALPGYGTQRGARPEDLPLLEPWARHWQAWTSAAFMESYLQTVESSRLVPVAPEAMRYLLDFFVLEKALYELRYELNNRPSWITIPLRTILQEIEGRNVNPEGGAAT